LALDQDNDTFDRHHLASIELTFQGTDTSSTAMSATFFYLCNNLEAYGRACSEVREKFPDGNVRPGGLLSSCRYLRACIDEAMRLSPPVGSVLWREVQNEGLSVDGHFIPSGSSLGTAIYTLHHDPDLYPCPFKYLPERWLENIVPGSQAAFNPFSIGPRSCVAKGLALHELQLAIATVLATFDFERVGPGEKELRLKEHITSSKDGPMLRFKRLQSVNRASGG
jgi:cytochrome P450